MRMSQAEIQRLWTQIRTIDAQLAPYEQENREADSLLRQALRHGDKAQRLAAYDHRFERRHCNWTLTKHLLDERRYLMRLLPRQSP